MAQPFVRAWLAGAVLSGAPSTVHALATGRPVLAATRAAGTLLGRPTVVRGALAHAAISAGWAGVLLRAGVRGPGSGAVAGAAIAALDLGLVAPRVSPAIAALPALPQLADHVAFGALVGAAARISGRRSGPRPPGTPRPPTRT